MLPRFGYLVIKLVFFTIRMKFIDDRFVRESMRQDKPIIFSFWHNRLAYMPYGYTQEFGKTNLITMISRSKDGKLVGRICELFGLTVAYGSSSRGGSEALREMIRMAKEKNMDCGITPDGPRGPKYEVQPGILSVAQSTGMPIVPLCYDVTCKIRLKSWDGFYVPIPFSRGVVMFGEPLYVPDTLTDDKRSELIRELKLRMDGICEKSKKYIAEIKSKTVRA
jgi:lysophospholipid acyltransferase (LPLAT)-like uncharacterized protein